MKLNKLLLALAASGIATSAFATNGMLMEGYGPISLGMGGASMAYDNGTAAMMNNPATLGLMAAGSQVDVAVGSIRPDIDVSFMGHSSAEAFYMPAFGYAKKEGKLAYGVGMFAQGGMGTEYSFMGTAPMAQVSVGRLMAALAYDVDDKLTVGGTLDYVFGMMDLVYQGAMDMVNNTPDNLQDTPFEMNFKDGSDFTGKADASGIAGKLGVVYKANDKVTLGAAYQTKGNLSDMSGGGYRMTGFDMPAVAAVGFSVKANDKTQVAIDVKEIYWSDVMKTPVVYGPGLTNIGGNSGAMFTQNWEDQTVVSLGVAYKYSDALTVRVGANLSQSPIPNTTLSALWPATVENHFTAGFGYAMDKDSGINFALSYAPTVTVTNPAMFDMVGGPDGGSNGVPETPGTVTHSQLNWQLSYSKRF